MIIENESVLAIQELDLTDHTTFSVLQDFQCFLKKLTEQPVSLSKGKKQPSVKWAQSMDAEFTDQADVQLNRPMAIHYPLVLGFQVLVVATDLGRVVGSPKGAPLLHIAPELLDQWQKLNDAERYFTLCQAWLNRGHSAIIGEGGRRMDDRFLFSFGANLLNDDFWQGAPPHRPDALDRLPKYIGAWHIALLKAFGLAIVEFSDNSNTLNRFQLTPWGSLFLSTCRSEALRQMMDENNDEDDIELDILRTVSACRSDVKETVTAVDVDTEDFLLKVTMDDVPYWFRLAAQKTLTFDGLADAILDAVSFEERDHSYYFDYRNAYGKRLIIGSPYMCDLNFFTSDAGLTSATTLADIGLVAGQSLEFVFDMGANWLFCITVESHDHKAPDKVRLLESDGTPPRQYSDDD